MVLLSDSCISHEYALVLHRHSMIIFKFYEGKLRSNFLGLSGFGFTYIVVILASEIEVKLQEEYI